ncbi:MAG: L,D-transpeptidase family protein [Verrucomicrobiota bacterium]
MLRCFFPLVALAVSAAPNSLTAFEISPQTTQVLVGVAEGWNSSYVTLTLYERGGLFGKKEGWKVAAGPWKGRLGYNGLVWGHGVHPKMSGTTKREGDGRSPAGVFLLGGAWGYEANVKSPKAQTYQQVTTRDLWYEDPNSPYYNQHRRITHEPRTTEEKKAQMKQNDYPHSLKLFIRHNAEKGSIIPGAGSSIFFHIWRRGGAAATAGCTTIHESHMRSLIAKIDPARHPLYVLLPKAEYERYREPWKLP